MTGPTPALPRSYRVDVLPPAQAVLAELLRFFRSVDPAHGAKLVRRLLDAAQSLRSLPYRFQVYRRSSTARRTIRGMVAGKYRIFYRVRERDAVVEVILFRHGARRPPTRFPTT